MAGVSVYGKLRTQPEFLKVNLGTAQSHEFVRWLETAHETLVRAGQRLPEGPLRFVFTTPGAATALIGALIPSQDSVGRSFPMAAFGTVSLSELTGRAGKLPLAFDRSLSALEAALAQGGPWPELSVQADWTVAAVQDVPAQPLLALLESVPGEASSEYGLHAFQLACAAVREAEPGQTRVVLDCPTMNDGPGFWLELFSRLTRWKTGAPSLLWSPSQGRALVSLGPLPASIFNFWVQPERAGNLLWPLKTQVRSAMDRAKGALSPSVRNARTLRELVDAFG